MKRWNITLPDELSDKLASFPNKSKFIAEALSEKIEKMRKRELDRLLIEGYQATRRENQRINREWEPASLDDW